MHMSALMTLLIADVLSLVLCIMLGAYLLLLSLGSHVVPLFRLTSKALQVVGWTQTTMQMLSMC